MQILLELKNAAELERLFYAAPEVSAREYRRGLERIAIRVAQEARNNAPVAKNQWGTGGGKNLRQSINYTYDSSTGGYVVRADKPYALYVDQGTKPHVILPRFKKFLAWRDPSGKWVYAKRVNHPGTKPTHFFTDAVENSKDFGNAEMEAAMIRIIRTF